MTAPAPTAEPSSAPTLHQPRRGLIAVVEVVLVVLLAFAAHWCWQRGIQTFSYPVEGRPPLVSTRYHGNWIGGSIVLATVAGILLLDAIRQTLLAVRTRDRRPPEDVAQTTDELV
ncbi:hypothetical protein ACFFQW_38595 [Umezawaea endophytica]|uniref:Uncharacterized protein n=1 Tax=Umezawaea endophytica TaxID=1654476 RepID=A0A9X2VU49_9PSEU|nr:hypothetical protein [Umezawaea endophytica]MCS7482991.1 hypothetical protein [Umezawaea endophytica]